MLSCHVCRLAAILAFCLASDSVGAAQIAITHVAVINPGTSSVQPNQTLVITGDHITSVAETAQAQIPKNARVIDATGQYVIPGLWDMHVRKCCICGSG